MKVLLLSLGFGMITMIDLPGLMKKKDLRGIAIYAILLFVGYALSLIQALGIEIPSPSEIIKIIVKSLVDINFAFTP